MAPELPTAELRLEGITTLDAALAVIRKLLAENRALMTRVQSLEEQNHLLQKKVAELEAKLGRPPKTPGNSSVPPSRGMKPNGQAGTGQKRRVHPGAWRRLCDDPTRIDVRQTQTCPHCAADVSGVAQVVAETYDHVEIPRVVVDVTRVVLQGGVCPCCSKAFKAAPPPGMEPGSPFGPNLRALVLHQRQTNWVSYERLAASLDAQYGLKISEGALASILEDSAEAFAAQGERIRQQLLGGTVIGSDETGFRMGKKNHWLWTFQNAASCCFVFAAGRGKSVIEGFLGEVRPQVWVSDRLAAQSAGWGKKQQVCLAHLLRDAKFALECGDTVLAPLVMSLLCRAMRVWRHRARLEKWVGAGAQATFFWRFSMEMADLLATAEPVCPAGTKLRRVLLKNQDNLFVFLAVPGVPPTNNSSEQALRPSTVFRKVTNCFRSAWGAKLHADVRTVIETARRRGIGALEAIRLTLQDMPLPAKA